METAAAIGDERAGETVRNVALPLGVAVEQSVHDDGAARVGEELAAQADQAAAGHAELDAHAAVAVIVHVGDFAFARSELLHDHADEILPARRR